MQPIEGEIAVVCGTCHRVIGVWNNGAVLYDEEYSRPCSGTLQGWHKVVLGPEDMKALLPVIVEGSFTIVQT